MSHSRYAERVARGKDAYVEAALDSVKTLIGFKANVNAKNHKGITPLMSVSLKGVMETVRLLLEAGADVNAAAKDGYTALMCAAYYGHAELAACLLDQGADKNAMGKKGGTALSIARKKKFEAVAAILDEFHWRGNLSPFPFHA